MVDGLKLGSVVCFAELFSRQLVFYAIVQLVVATSTQLMVALVTCSRSGHNVLFSISRFHITKRPEEHAPPLRLFDTMLILCKVSPPATVHSHNTVLLHLLHRRFPFCLTSPPPPPPGFFSGIVSMAGSLGYNVGLFPFDSCDRERSI